MQDLLPIQQKNTVMTTFECYSLILAVITGICGTLLGAFNIWYALSRDRVKLRVIPKFRLIVGNMELTAEQDAPEYNLDRHLSEQQIILFAIEVVNLSAFPITITGVGVGKGNMNVRISNIWLSSLLQLNLC